MTESKAPPSSIEAEESVIGVILNDSEYLNRVLDYIPDNEVFYNSRNKIIWEKILEMKKDKTPIDVITLLSKMNNIEKQSTGAYYLTGLTTEAPSKENVEYYAKIILEKYLQRKLIHASYKIQSLAYDNEMEFEKILDEVHRHTTELQELKPTKEYDMETEIDRAIMDIKEPENVIEYGFKKLDSLAGGMTKGEVTIIAGRPGHGKTTFAINLVKNLLDSGLKVLMINREMSNKEMFKKFLVMVSDSLSYKDVRLAKLTDQELIELDETKKTILDKYNNLTMFDDIIDLQQSHSVIRKLKPDIIVDDYIQLTKVPGHKDRRFEIEEIMKEYKWLAKTMHIPIILLSQLNREIEKREDPIPKTSDLAESGSIEQIAENILFVYYDWKVKYERSHLGKNQIQIVAGKVRYGETGIATLGFDGDKCRFTNSKEDVMYKSKGV